MTRLALAALAAAALGPLQAHAAAAGCKLQSVDVPVEMHGLRPMVAAKIDGHPVKLLLDSGAFYSFIDAKFATEKKLHPVKAGGYTGSKLASEEEVLTTGAAGRERLTGLVQAESFEFAGAKWPNAQFLVHEIGGGEGILGQNLLHGMDLDFDLKDGRLKLVQADGCRQASLAYWVGSGQTYSLVDLESTRVFHTMATIQINGVAMKAYLDTGAGTSFITYRAAERAGVKTTDANVKRAGISRGLDDVAMKTWVAPFASVKIGDEEVRNAKLAIGESNASDFDVLLGADFFLAHHVYVANSQGKIYFTYSGGPVFRTPKADEAAPADGADQKAAK